MFERETRLNGLMFYLLRRLLDDMDDAQLAMPLAENGNPPAWILGHLVVVNDFALRNLGEARVAPAEWHLRFKPGASPKDDPSPLPTKEELLGNLEMGRERILAALARVDAAALEQPHTVDFLKQTPVKTVGDVIAHLMTTHFAFHMGQISAFRRRLGKAPLV